MIESGEADLSKVRLFVGGATWSQEQLRDEVNKGWWIQGEASADFVSSPRYFSPLPLITFWLPSLSSTLFSSGR